MFKNISLHKLMFQNRVLRNIFRCMREEVTEVGQNCIMREELQNTYQYSSLNNIRINQIKKNEIGEAS
jgi:hypothetical protein